MKIRKFNESEEYNLSFDGFKDVMSDITDEVDLNHDFNDYSAGEGGDRFYELEIHLPRINEYIDFETSMTYRYLEYAGSQGGITHPEDGGEDIDTSKIREYINLITGMNGSLLDIKSKIDTQVENNNMAKKVLVSVAKIKTRLESFDNYNGCRLGFDGDTISITFEIK